MIEVREHGTAGPPVLVLHGGPGAAGSAAALARGLAPRFRVGEPLQRGSGATPLTVARHVADLDELILARGNDPPPAVVGHSWGAMLALAYAAAHPERVTALALVGCGTYDLAARARLIARRDERMDQNLRGALDRLSREIDDEDRRLSAMARLIQPIFDYDPVAEDEGPVHCDARAHEETWHDMLRRQEAGDYPATFRAVTAPVLMLHGTYDPHPGTMIRDGLLPVLPHLEYHEWERCGHHPWRERAVRDEFFVRLGDWLERRWLERATV